MGPEATYEQSAPEIDGCPRGLALSSSGIGSLRSTRLRFRVTVCLFV